MSVIPTTIDLVRNSLGVLRTETAGDIAAQGLVDLMEAFLGDFSSHVMASETYKSMLGSSIFILSLEEGSVGKSNLDVRP